MLFKRLFGFCNPIFDSHRSDNMQSHRKLAFTTIQILDSFADNNLVKQYVEPVLVEYLLTVHVKFVDKTLDVVNLTHENDIV